MLSINTFSEYPLLFLIVCLLAATAFTKDDAELTSIIFPKKSKRDQAKKPPIPPEEDQPV